MNVTDESLVVQALRALPADHASVTLQEMRDFAREHGGDELARVAGLPVLPGIDYRPLAAAVEGEADVRRAMSDPAWRVWTAWAVALGLSVATQELDGELS
ncbi:hypothetical protein [Actinoplanes sp. NPDC051411]|uniref:hypothetical protein n=1 Tax=Actinoplanes sp. NPDC051411 TaxID=3155522 RepID=UPI0034441B71